jgi:hypothetical protein
VSNLRLVHVDFLTTRLFSSALVGATDASGASIFAGQAFTGFSNAEEEQVGMVKAIPFLLEDELSSRGGKYEKAAELWGVSYCCYS